MSRPIANVVLIALSLSGLGMRKPPAIREIEIVGRDYSFQVPTQVAPGLAVFRFTNLGKVRHELNVGLLKEGVTVKQFMDTLWADKPVTPLLEGPVGVLFAKKGKRASAGLETDLKAGRDYVIICIFRDSAGAKRHHQMGMYSRMHVSVAKPIEARSVKTDTIVGVDYAFKYNRTVPPGLHSFAFRNEGAHRHEVSFALLKHGVSVDSVYKIDKAGGNIDKLFDETPGLLHAQPGITPLGRIRLNLLPGREYMLECGFQDSTKAPMHYELGMFGSIKVGAK